MLSREKKIAAFFFIIFIALLAGGVFLAWHIDKKFAQTAELFLEAEKQVSDEEKIRELEKIFKETENDRLLINSYFIKKADAVKFIEQIENIGIKSGVRLSVSNVAVQDKDSSLKVDFVTEGSFQDTMYFLALIDEMPFKVRFDRANIEVFSSAEDQAEAEGSWKGSFTFVLESFLLL